MGRKGRVRTEDIALTRMAARVSVNGVRAFDKPRVEVVDGLAMVYDGDELVAIMNPAQFERMLRNG